VESLIPTEAPPPVEVPVEVTLPEGVAPDDQLLASFKPLAKELSLDSAKAQKLVDLYAGALKAHADKSSAAWAAEQSKWAETVKSDKELGGAQFDSTKVGVKKFFDTFDRDGSIRKDITSLGLGNHPALVRLAARAAKLISEDSVAGSSAPAGDGLSSDDILAARYPTMFPKQ
jgi:hypothetical protein